MQTRLGRAALATALAFAWNVRAQEPAMQEKALTTSPKNHDLDFNDNFPADGRYLCYDTREMVGPSLDNCQSIEMLELATGREIVVYKPEKSVIGENPAPGMGAVSFNPAKDEVAFIHGPMVDEVPARGPYGKPNRCGARVEITNEFVELGGVWRMLRDGKQPLAWLDKRDVAVDRDTLPGAHRGGTHRHEYCATGRRVGFTYDDFLMPQYDRNIGYLEPHPDAPAPASHWFAVLVDIAPMGKSKPGEIEKAYGDSWAKPDGSARAFIGKARNDDGETYEESLFVVDIPDGVDITTADAGSATRYPSAPKGLRVRRLTHDWAGGIVRGAPDGSRIAYYGKDAEGQTQVFVIPVDGSDRSDDPALRPVQATRLPGGSKAGVRWHPSGKSLITQSDDGIAAVCAVPGPDFGKTVFITPHGDGKDRHAGVISPDGTWVAYNRLEPTPDGRGGTAKTYAGLDMKQIFAVPYPGGGGVF